MQQADGAPKERSALQRHEELVQGLMRPGVLAAAGDRVERIDTHVSTVLLAGAHAYKLRKPVNLGFLDFSTLERRRRDCEEEIRLNRRTAPQLYEEVVAFQGTVSEPHMVSAAGLDGEEPLEYAVRMQRFEPCMALDRLAQRDELTPALIEQIAEAVARLHASARRARPDLRTAQTVARWTSDNLAAIRADVQSAADRARIDALAHWSQAELSRHREHIEQRGANGFVRECHGDLHLGNMVLLGNSPVLFDAIEFNAELRFIDVISDVAFTFMDLVDHGHENHAWQFIGAYLEITGDYDGLKLLRLYAVYRALVRAKVALIRLHQPNLSHHGRLREHTSFEHYLRLAERLREPGLRALVAMTGLSGSGKSTAARTLAAVLGGVRIRSDVERKRLHGLMRAEESAGRIYSVEANARTYDQLAVLAESVLRAEVPVVIDAACLKRDERSRFERIAAALRAIFAIVVCEAPTDVLRSRLQLRAATHDDASEATVDVLERQLGWRQPLDDAERQRATIVDTSAGFDEVERRCLELARALRARAATVAA